MKKIMLRSLSMFLVFMMLSTLIIEVTIAQAISNNLPTFTPAVNNIPDMSTVYEQHVKELPNPSNIVPIDTDFTVVANKVLDEREINVLKMFRTGPAQVELMGDTSYYVFNPLDKLLDRHTAELNRRNYPEKANTEQGYKLKLEISQSINENAVQIFEERRTKIEDLYFVEYANPDQIVDGNYYYYNDPMFNQQSNLDSYFYNGGIGPIEEYIDFFQGGATVNVAILDSGYNTSHEDISSSRIISPKYYTEGTIIDYNGHGTAALGIIGATSNNGKGVIGICDKCKLMPIKVLNSNASGTWSALTSGVYWAIDHGAEVMSISIGGTANDSAFGLSLEKAYAKNIVVVASAGNTGTNVKVYPGAYNTTLTVGASYGNDPWSGSTWGDWVDISAPSNVPVTTWKGTSNSYNAFSATSAAAPQVAASVGLAISYLKQHNKQYTVESIRNDIIKQSFNYFDPYVANKYGVGVISLEYLDDAVYYYNPYTAIVANAYGVNNLGTTQPMLGLYINGSKVSTSKNVPLNQWTSIIWDQVPNVGPNDEVAIAFENDAYTSTNDIDVFLWNIEIYNIADNYFNSVQVYGGSSNLKYDLGTLNTAVDNLSLQPTSYTFSNGYVYRWRDYGQLLWNGAVRTKGNGSQATTNW